MNYISKYLSYLALEKKARNTLLTYRFHLETFYSWLTHLGKSENELRSLDLIDFKEQLLRNGKSERTVNAIISCVRGYFDYLILAEIVETNPVSRLLHIRVSSTKQERLSDDELNVFYNHIDGLTPHVRAAFYLLIGSGARVSEITELTKNDFHLKEGKLYIDIVNAKWGSDRFIPIINTVAAKVVHEHLETLDISSLPAFRISKRTMQRYAQNFADETGINFSCHILRHTFATLLLEQGVPIEKIQYLLGHKTPQATRHYTQSANIEIDSLAATVWQGEDVFVR